MSSKEGLHLIVCCKHPEILDTLLRVINQKTMHSAVGCLCVNELKDIFHHNHPDLVLIGSGFTEQEESNIQIKVNQLNPNVTVVFHYGGGSGLLHAEINAAMASQQTESLG